MFRDEKSLGNAALITLWGDFCPEYLPLSRQADIIRQHRLVQNRILEFRRKEKQNTKTAKCGVRFENSPSQYEAKCKKNFLQRNKNHSSS